MKSILFFCACCSLLPIKATPQTPSHQADSMQVSPAFSFVTLAGQQVFSSDLKGKVIVLDFWSTDCNPCRKSMPQMEDFYRRFKNDPRVAVYLVNSGWETIDKARSFASSKRSGFLFFSWGTTYDLPFAYDNGSTTLAAFGFDSNPSTVIIDSKFRIRVKHSGYIEKFYDFLSGHVEQCLAEL
jgi:thiol-disulfide isomerase/thioredoxin